MPSGTLDDYVDAHYNVICDDLRKLLAQCLVKSHGNPFAQLIHDCVTLDNGLKYCAVGINFIDPDLEKNRVVCIGFRKPAVAQVKN